MNTTVSLMISSIIFLLILRGHHRGMRKPLKPSGITLLLPIVYISTSLTQLFDPRLQIHEVQLAIALLIGVMLSIPLIVTTSFEVRENGETLIQRSKAVFVLLITIFALRFLVIAMVHSIDPSTLSFLCNLATLGYIATWRIVSFIKFRSVSGSNRALLKG